MGSGSFTIGEKKQRCLLNGRLDGPQSRAVCYGVEKNLLTLLGIEPRTYCTYVTITDYFAIMVCVSETENDGTELSYKFLISEMKSIDKISKFDITLDSTISNLLSPIRK
jgi:hypothetical protein